MSLSDETRDRVETALDLAKMNLDLGRNGPAPSPVRGPEPAEAAAASLALAHMYLERAGHDTGYEWRSTGAAPVGPRCPECGSAGPPLQDAERDGLVCGACWEPSPVSGWYGNKAAVEAVHGGEREAVLRAIADQASELHDEPHTGVTCPCGNSGPLRLMHRCFFCEVFFCPRCAEEHFGDEDHER